MCVCVCVWIVTSLWAPWGLYPYFNHLCALDIWPNVDTRCIIVDWINNYRRKMLGKYFLMLFISYSANTSLLVSRIYIYISQDLWWQVQKFCSHKLQSNKKRVLVHIIWCGKGRGRAGFLGSGNQGFKHVQSSLLQVGSFGFLCIMALFSSMGFSSCMGSSGQI